LDCRQSLSSRCQPSHAGWVVCKIDAGLFNSTKKRQSVAELQIDALGIAGKTLPATDLAGKNGASMKLVVGGIKLYGGRKRII
jgi:hypothetical protein